jgi:hypothetical protein
MKEARKNEDSPQRHRDTEKKEKRRVFDRVPGLLRD